ncbi:hypothetical protein [Streptomyces coryli]|nr:hypothetical protein [Streptomyces coryli]
MTRRAAHRAAAAAVCAGLLLAAGCSSGDNSDSDKPKASPKPSATVDAKEAAAKRKVQEVYEGMRREQRKTYLKATIVGTDLRKYTYDKALGNIKQELFRMQQAGVVYKGEAKSTVKVLAVDLEADPQKAMVDECYDTSNWKPVLKKTGKDVSNDEQHRRYHVTGTVETVGKGNWMVTDYEPDRGRPC